MINFYGDTKHLRARKTKIKAIIKYIIKDNNYELTQLNYIIVDDEALLTINAEMLNHDFYTDIITFDYTEGAKIDGEIYISIDRVKDNAAKYKQEFHVELLRVVFHGVLHIVGFGDKTKSEKSLMRKKEDYYLSQYQKLFHVEHKV